MEKDLFMPVLETSATPYAARFVTLSVWKTSDFSVGSEDCWLIPLA